MKINSYEECVRAYGNSDAALLGITRESPYLEFPYTVIVEGYFYEFDELDKWLYPNLGPVYADPQFAKENTSVNGKWRAKGYGKIEYDYEFEQFFFKEREDRELFEKTVTETYTTGPKGKWKSDGFNKFINENETMKN